MAKRRKMQSKRGKNPVRKCVQARMPTRAKAGRKSRVVGNTRAAKKTCKKNESKRSSSILPFREVSSVPTSLIRIPSQYIREPVDPSTIPEALPKARLPKPVSPRRPHARKRTCRLPEIDVDYRGMEEWVGMEYRPVQLARVYRFVRDERTGVEDGDIRTWSQQYVKEERAMQTGKTVADMVKAVSLQPAIQSVTRRIKDLPLNGRPVPDTVDTDLLGTELKVRLAARAPVLRTIVDSLGSCHVTSTRRHARHVPIYEIDSFDDAHLMCTMRMCVKSKKSSGDKEKHLKPKPI